MLHGHRFRDDDPDLIRAGTWPTAEGCLADGATARSSLTLDVDGDGSVERVMSVAPREDPSPQNTESGLILARRTDDGWRATVLHRLVPSSFNDDNLVVEYERYWRWNGPMTASVVHLDGRPRLLLSISGTSDDERFPGPGYISNRHDLRIIVGLRGGEPHAEGACARVEREGHRGVWRGLRFECVGLPRYIDGAVRLDPTTCASDSPDWSRDTGGWEAVETAPPAWCRALRAQR